MSTFSAVSPRVVSVHRDPVTFATWFHLVYLKLKDTKNVPSCSERYSNIGIDLSCRFIQIDRLIHTTYRSLSHQEIVHFRELARFARSVPAATSGRPRPPKVQQYHHFFHWFKDPLHASIIARLPTSTSPTLNSSLLS